MKWMQTCMVIVGLAAAAPAVAAVPVKTLAGHSAVDGLPALEDGADEATSAVVNLSGVSRGEPIRARYYLREDSVVMELMPDVRIDFGGDSAGLRWLLCIEGRTWCIDCDSLLINGATVQTNSARLSVDLSRRFILSGTLTTSFSDNNTIIFEPGDTLTNVSRLTLSFIGTSTSLSADSAQTPATATRSYWFAEDSPWPVAVATSASNNHNTFYIFPPSIQTDDKPTFANRESPSPYEAILNSLHTGLSLARAANPTPGLKQPASNPRKSITEDLTHAGVTVTAEGRNISVGLSDGAVSESAMLCDLLGRVYPPSVRADNQLRYNSLPPGEYILTLTINETPITHRIHISD